MNLNDLTTFYSVQESGDGMPEIPARHGSITAYGAGFSVLVWTQRVRPRLERLGLKISGHRWSHPFYAFEVALLPAVAQLVRVYRRRRSPTRAERMARAEGASGVRYRRLIARREGARSL